MHGTATTADLDETTSIGDHDMTITKPGICLATAALIAAVVIAGCGGRFGARGAEAGPADTDAGVVAVGPSPSAAPATTPGTTDQPASAEPSSSATPPASAAPATSATPTPTAKPTPVPTPNLDALDALINQLDAALAADATATTDEGSPE